MHDRMPGDGYAPDRRLWTWREDQVLLKNYPHVGARGCGELLPARRKNQIIGRANWLGLRAPNSRKRTGRRAHA